MRASDLRLKFWRFVEKHLNFMKNIRMNIKINPLLRFKGFFKIFYNISLIFLISSNSHWITQTNIIHTDALPIHNTLQDKQVQFWVTQSRLCQTFPVLVSGSDPVSLRTLYIFPKIAQNHWLMSAFYDTTLKTITQS